MIPKPVAKAPTIQKRITTLDSGQPFASKWWWTGAMRKTFLLNSFLEVIWMMQERVSITKMNPMNGRIKTWSVSMAMTPSVAPRLRAPVSPM